VNTRNGIREQSALEAESEVSGAPQSAGVMEQVLQSTSDAVFALDREWRLQFANASAAALFRIEESAAAGANFWDLLPQAGATGLASQLPPLMEERVAGTFRIFYPEPVGRWLEVQAYPAEDGLSVFLREADQQQEAEETARLQRQAIEAVPAGILITRSAPGGEQTVVYANPAFLRLTGYEEAEILGRDPRFLQAHDRHQPAGEQLRAALKEGRAEVVMLRNYRKGGAQWINELHISPLRGAGGEVTHFVGVQSDVTQRLRMREHLIRQAQYDALTELPNRHRFLHRLQESLEDTRERGTELAVIYLDVDNLKDVNDTLGHAQGDTLLRVVAQRLAAVVRAEDTMARLGADEFALFCTGYADRAQLEALLGRLLSSVCMPLNLGGRELLPSVSVGCAVAPGDASEAEELLRMADMAMYAAKNDDKNTWRTYKPSMDSGQRERLLLADAMRQAIARREFVLFYQPRVDAVSRRVTSLEALIRWQHPDRGLLFPGSFITIAEQTGLIQEIGRWVLEEAARQNCSWQAEGVPVVPISVNVSPAQMRRADFVASVVGVVKGAGLNPHLLELELTESLLVDQTIANDALLHLREHGLRIAIDDFGTGYSALNYLAKFPVDTLKVDRSFITPITSNESSAAICRYILQLGRELGLTTVAEGVETAEEADLLRGWGCDELQGYLFSKPIPADQVVRMLA
jgi:diguanylate cyclase (GGDEF)-like protein/PAS domain S-box-containing protein